MHITRCIKLSKAITSGIKSMTHMLQFTYNGRFPAYVVLEFPPSSTFTYLRCQYFTGMQCCAGTYWPTYVSYSIIIRKFTHIQYFLSQERKSEQIFTNVGQCRRLKEKNEVQLWRNIQYVCSSAFLYKSCQVRVLGYYINYKFYVITYFHRRLR